ncbi:MAG: rRNA maturation RNase YbeY [Candidatus Coatesbacteria bacterium]|nr:rRNA maturation RNase YbeY [Candidatus Coatesbacteria bacterium]
MIEIISDAGLDSVDETWARSVVSQTLRAIGRGGAAVNVLFSGDERIRGLNLKFRGVDAPTDVMAFPSEDEGSFLGDVIISVQTAKSHADELGHSLDEELSVLLVHGILHLLGYTDYDGPSKSDMFRKTDDILKQLNVSHNQGR